MAGTENLNSNNRALSDDSLGRPVQTVEVAKREPFTLRDTSTTSFLNPEVYLQMKSVSHDMIASRAIPTVWQNADQVLVALQTGFEMGMKPMESLKSLYLVNGQINIWGAAIVRRLREHGYSIKYSNETQESCTATVTKGMFAEEDGAEEYVETYTFDEADASGYTKDSRNAIQVGWRLVMNRKLKLRYGVLSLIIKTYLPEVLGAATGIVEVEQDAIIQDEQDDNNNKKLIESAEKKRKSMVNKKDFKPQVIDISE